MDQNLLNKAKQKAEGQVNNKKIKSKENQKKNKRNEVRESPWVILVTYMLLEFERLNLIKY